MSHLFSEFTLKGVTLRNRIGMSPMTMYRSTDGPAGRLPPRCTSGPALPAGSGSCSPSRSPSRRRAAPASTAPASRTMRRSRGYARVTAMIKRMGAVAGHPARATPGARAARQPPWDGRGADRPRGPRRLAGRRPVGRPLRRARTALPRPRADRRRDPRASTAQYAAAARPRGRGRLRVARDALRARLPRLELLLTAGQPAQRRVRRQPGEPDALPCSRPSTPSARSGPSTCP